MRLHPDVVLRSRLIEPSDSQDADDEISIAEPSPGQISERLDANPVEAHYTVLVPVETERPRRVAVAGRIDSQLMKYICFVVSVLVGVSVYYWTREALRLIPPLLGPWPEGTGDNDGVENRLIWKAFRRGLVYGSFLSGLLMGQAFVLFFKPRPAGQQHYRVHRVHRPPPPRHQLDGRLRYA